MRVDFWLDPICPWCWRTSRWLLDAAAHRDVEVAWRSISLYEKHGRERGDPRHLCGVRATHRMLRVLERLQRTPGAGNAAAARFYTEVGAQIHHDGVRAEDVDLRRTLGALGVDPGLAAAAGDRSLDAAIRESMEEALELAGHDVGTPIVGFDGKAAYFGPVVDPVPTGEAATRLFDAVVTLATTPGMWELKRSRDQAELTALPRPRTVLPAA